ncbi:MAG TPA: VWA domain-containing protein [Acidobacteriaceae bacterium]|jgi:VWFA-related protein|nr:VWA domain-containing protein [Acidobacteriaceae bacterium]
MKRHALALTCILWATPATSTLAQTQATVAATTQDTSPVQASTLTARSTLVLVPALVRNKAGELVYTLKANDFVLTDDGVLQKLTLEQDTGGEPLALVVDLEGGGAGANQMDKFVTLAPMLSAIVGDVPHKIAVVGFDSSPVLVQDFTPDLDVAGHAIHALIDDDNGDNGAAILDSLGFSVDLLRKQPPEYRRAILLVSESNDHGSKLRLDEALREISDTNTVIYSIGFSTGRDELKTGVAKALSDPTPGPAHGCMSRDPNDPNVNLKENVAEQAYGCLSLLAPPLGIAKAVVIALFDGMQKNIPETVAHLTGGEYFKLGNQKSMERSLMTISNHIPNRYVLSFQAQSPHAGFHAIELRVPGYAGLTVSARNGYWADIATLPAN